MNRAAFQYIIDGEEHKTHLCIPLRQGTARVSGDVPKFRDEPLNYIDIYSRMQIENLIKEFAPTMILVEHDKAFRDEIGTERVSVLKTD